MLESILSRSSQFDPFPFLDWLVVRSTMLALLTIGAYVVVREAWQNATASSNAGKRIGAGREAVLKCRWTSPWKT